MDEEQVQGTAMAQTPMETLADRGQRVVHTGKGIAAGVAGKVSEAVRQVRADPTLQQPSTRKAALRLLAYLAGIVIVVNALLMRRRRWR